MLGPGAAAQASRAQGSRGPEALCEAKCEAGHRCGSLQTPPQSAEKTPSLQHGQPRQTRLFLLMFQKLPPVLEERESGKGQEGDLGSFPLSGCLLCPQCSSSIISLIQAGQAVTPGGGFASNLNQNELYKATPEFPALSQRISLSFSLPPYFSLSSHSFSTVLHSLALSPS